MIPRHAVPTWSTAAPAVVLQVLLSLALAFQVRLVCHADMVRTQLTVASWFLSRLAPFTFQRLHLSKELSLFFDIDQYQLVAPELPTHRHRSTHERGAYGDNRCGAKDPRTPRYLRRTS